MNKGRFRRLVGLGEHLSWLQSVLKVRILEKNTSMYKREIFTKILSIFHLRCWEATRLSHLIPLGDPLGWADMGDLSSEVFTGEGVLAILLTNGQAAEVVLKID